MVEQQLTDIYGYCIIPKNTLLFRGHLDESPDDCMFFATKFSGAIPWNAPSPIQIWKTTADIKVLFLIDYLNPYQGISSLPRIYNSLFPEYANPDFTDLDIKHHDINRRNTLVRRLFDDFNISGWFTSVESKTLNEVCLFDKQANSNQLSLIDNTSREDKNYFKDSLKKMKIFPPKSFYDQTIIKSNRREDYKQYKKWINGVIRDDVREKGMTKVEAEHFRFNLRVKLEI